MAVDANVLIFERIREELSNGRGPITAVDAGYRRAMTTIFDSNLTTLIAALLLFQFGTGPVKGRSEEHTSELQSLMRNSYAVFCLKKKKQKQTNNTSNTVHQQKKNKIK